MISQKENLSLTEKISSIFDTKKTDADWSFSECGRSDTNKWTHGYHRYPAKFIPQLVERLVSDYIPKGPAHINDPFFGSGTTIVTAISKGYVASGTDINGIAFLITKVKSTPIEPTLLSKKVDYFLNRIRVGLSDQTTLVDDPLGEVIPEKHKDKIDYWFSTEMQHKLGTILWQIRQEQQEDVRNFLLVGFSQILKNSSIWMQSSTKPTRDPRKRPSDPYPVLRKHLKKMMRGNKQFYEVVPKDVQRNLESYLHLRWGDARKQPAENGSVDMIVSSSPYVTSYEYADLHQLSTIWLDYANDLQKYKSEFIGSTQRSSGNGRHLRSDIGREIVNQLEQESKRLGSEVGCFFMDMEEVFDESYRILKPGGRCCFVIGNTRLKGVDVLNAQVFAESIQHSGFHFERLIKREIPSKILPQTRDKRTGRFTSSSNATLVAYPAEYIVVGKKAD